MERELQDYYEDRFATMATKGWIDFIEDTQNLFDTYNKINTAESFEEFHKRKGQLDILQWILSLKDASEQAYEELQNEEVV
jgi:hypothetical protein